MDKKKPVAHGNKPVAAKGKPAAAPVKGKAQSSASDDSNTKVIKHDFVCQSISNFMLIWVDSNIDPNDDDFKLAIDKLQQVTRNMHVFNDGNECANFIHTQKKEQIFLIVSGSLGKELLPRIHHYNQLIAVFIYCGDASKAQPLKQNYQKIREISTSIDHICQSIKNFSKEHDDEPSDVSFISQNDLLAPNTDRLDQSFMYTQLIKEILFELEYTDDNTREFIEYCQANFRTNKDRQIIAEFINEYNKGDENKSPIWWYTRETFLYTKLNSCLREQESDVIIKMGFFLTDIHQQISKLHSQQLSQLKEFSKTFKLHRGQGISQDMLEKLRNTQHGLLSFNNFLSTSFKEEVAIDFVQRAFNKGSEYAIIYHITVDPSIPSEPFASIDEYSYFEDAEREVLFSMHSIFRIGSVTQDHHNRRIWHAKLTLTSTNDEQLKNLTERIRLEIGGSTPSYRLGALMIKLGNYKKAEDLYKQLLLNTRDEVEKANLYFQLGSIYEKHNQYDNALKHYDDALRIYQKHLPPNHANIATCHNNIAIIYDNNGDYRKAIAYYEKAVAIYQSLLPDPHAKSSLATAYSSIGVAYSNSGDHKKGAKYCEDAIKIFKECSLTNHPMMATAQNNMGQVFINMKKKSDAEKYFKIALEIGKQVLPKNHPDLEQYKKNHAMSKL